MKATCKVKCYFQGIIWKPGDIYEGSEIDRGVENCFVVADPPKAPVPPKKEKK